MEQFDYWFCATCFKRSLTTSSLIKHDGCAGTCMGCGMGVIRHECAHAPAAVQAAWLPLLETGIGAVCPTCRLVIQIGQKVAARPSLPDWARALGGLATVAGIVVGAGLLIDKLIGESRA